jgi:hypothetical protein
MRGLADRFPEVTATPERYHTLISAGRIRLIACSASDPKNKLRDAAYKIEYANKSLNLYDPPPVTPSTDDFLFTILLHGADRLQPSQPAFAKILFVTKELKIWHEFDLFSRHMHLVKSLWIPIIGVDQDGLPDIRLRDEDEEQSQ